ncbi:hypothetical protein D3C77_776560 [compost metagenome]
MASITKISNSRWVMRCKRGSRASCCDVQANCVAKACSMYACPANTRCTASINTSGAEFLVR